MTGYSPALVECQCCEYSSIALHAALARYRQREHAKMGHKVTIEFK